jgi:hypothetical protein
MGAHDDGGVTAIQRKLEVREDSEVRQRRLKVRPTSGAFSKPCDRSLFNNIHDSGFNYF